MAKWEEYSTNIKSSRLYHERYHKAVSNPKRRKILQLIAEGKSEEEIALELGISVKELEYHLAILEWGFCIERKDGKLRLTKEGEVVEHLH